MNVTERRLVLSTWLRWTSLARVVEAANLAGITEPLERYRFVAVRAHGMSGAALDDFLAFARERLADSTWQPIADHLPPELIVGERGATLLRAHGLYPPAPSVRGEPRSRHETGVTVPRRMARIPSRRRGTLSPPGSAGSNVPQEGSD